jgi:DNA-binding response OmpR family regulator
MRPRILIIEDETSLVNTLEKTLSKDNELTITTTYNEGLKKAATANFDLIILDILLPNKWGYTGLDICKKLVNHPEKPPILVISIKDAINYKLGALKFGADDYLCKPFNYLELKARIENLLKRYGKARKLQYKGLEIDTEKHQIVRDSKVITLRTREYQILKALINNLGKTLTREALLCTGGRNDAAFSNTIDVHIRNLRKNIDDPFETKLIHTVHGIGYKME